MSKLYLVRHGESEWNKQGLWTGHKDIDLAENGYEEAKKAGELLKGVQIDVAYVSTLKRTHQTFDKIKEVCGKDDLVCQAVSALNERDYGLYTGKNKWQIKEEIGDEEFQRLRRGWDTPVPEGETLKDVSNRVVPYYEEAIKKDLKEGKNVLVVSHGNTLRALIKHLENMDDVSVCNVEVKTGEVVCYEFDENGQSKKSEVLK